MTLMKSRRNSSIVFWLILAAMTMTLMARQGTVADQKASDLPSESVVVDGSGPADGPKQAAEAQRAAACERLHDASFIAHTSAAFEARLRDICEGPQRPVKVKRGKPPILETTVSDVLVNDPTGDTMENLTNQSETSIAVRPSDGRLCAGWNDNGHFLQTGSRSGYGYSTDHGQTWTDGGVLPGISGSANYGDPDVDYSGADGRFYYLTLDYNGIALHASSDGCVTFPFHYQVAIGGSSVDKPMMAIEPGGRIHVVYTIFVSNPGGPPYTIIQHAYSNNGGVNWIHSQLASNTFLQAAWPVVANTGRIYVAWYLDNATTFSIKVMQIDIGLNSITKTTRADAVTGIIPSDPAASADCVRPALNGHIRHLPFPQLAFYSGVLHVVYARDPDTYNSGDASNVYYRRSTNGGVSWGSEVKLNDDTTSRDQFFPALAVGGSGRLVVYWYDRRNAPANDSFQIYMRRSTNNGISWQANETLSDGPSSLPILYPDSEPTLPPDACYMGDYNEADGDASRIHAIWSDNRNFQNGQPDADVWYEPIAVGTQCGPCQTDYCAGEGSRCWWSSSCGAGGCCLYTCQPDPSCTLPDPLPPNACGGA